MEVKKIEKKVDTKFYADNGKYFSVGTDIAFVLDSTGDKYVANIVKVKKKHIVINDIEVNHKRLPSANLLYMKVRYEDIRDNSCEYVYYN